LYKHTEGGCGSWLRSTREILPTVLLRDGRQKLKKETDLQGNYVVVIRGSAGGIGAELGRVFCGRRDAVIKTGC